MNKSVGLGGAITAVAVAAIPVLRAFGVNVTEDQANALLGLLAALIGLGTYLASSRVVNRTTAERAITEAFHADPKTQKRPSLATAGKRRSAV